MCMRAELVPDGYDQSNVAEQAAAGGIMHKDGKGHKKRVRCPEMRYNKFQMYDLKDGTSGGATSGSDSASAAGATAFANHSSPPANSSGRNEATSPDKSPIHLHQSVESDVKDIKRYLRQLLQRIHAKEERGKMALEWRIVALVMDRLFFYMYLAAIVISLATIFPKTY